MLFVFIINIIQISWTGFSYHLDIYTCAMPAIEDELAFLTGRSILEVVTGNFIPYYASILIYAFQSLLCLQICQHNRHSIIR